MYCTLADVKQYLRLENAPRDDALLNSLIQAAGQRINDYTKRRFDANVDTTHYFDALHDVDGKTLCLTGDLSHITSISNNGAAMPSTEYVTDPRNETPWEALKIKSGSTYTWDYTGSHEDAISVTGRWAMMYRRAVTSIARASNIVTATVTDTSGLSAGQKINLAGVADTGFNGSFILTAVTDTTVTWRQTGSNDTDTSGVILFCPPAIRQACIRLTAWLYRQKDTQQGDIDRPLLAGDGNIIMPTTIPQDVQAVLKEWVKHR